MSTTPTHIPSQPPPGVPVAALAQCSFNMNGQPLLTYQGKRWLFEGQRWKRMPNPDLKKGARRAQ